MQMITKVTWHDELLQVLICDALNLPYRDESFDAALSIAVIQSVLLISFLELFLIF